ncbi:MAG: hypothetical protein ACK4UX_12675 [Thiobacillus sp.]
MNDYHRGGWGERRHHCRGDDQRGESGFWVSDRSENYTQFFTRYLFCALALIYFSTLDGIDPVLLDVEQLLMALGAYFVLNSWFFHLALRGVTLMKIRSAMAADLIIVTLCVMHDPNAIPPPALAFLMVLVGNGMRYGMGVFAEVLGGVFLGMALSFAVRYRFGGLEIGAGDVFFGIFWVTLALYAYILMGRIEGQRRQLDYRGRFDALTGLLNRHGLVAAGETIFGRAAANVPATVLFADSTGSRKSTTATVTASAIACSPSSRRSSASRLKWACAGAGTGTSSSPSCRNAARLK